MSRSRRGTVRFSLRLHGGLKRQVRRLAVALPDAARDQRKFLREGLGCRRLRLLGIQTWQIPDLVPKALLPHVPPPAFVLLEWKDGAHERLVSELVALFGARTLQHAAFLEEDAPAVHHPEHHLARLR